MQSDTRSKIEGLRFRSRISNIRWYLKTMSSLSLDRKRESKYRYLSKKCCYSENILCQEIVQREHIMLFRTKEYIIGQILHDFSDQEETSAHLLGWCGSNQPFCVWCHNGRAKETQEDEGTNGGELGFVESPFYCR